jgi:hypothetical protein
MAIANHRQATVIERDYAAGTDMTVIADTAIVVERQGDDKAMTDDDG